MEEIHNISYYIPYIIIIIVCIILVLFYILCKYKNKTNYIDSNSLILPGLLYIGQKHNANVNNKITPNQSNQVNQSKIGIGGTNIENIEELKTDITILQTELTNCNSYNVIIKNILLETIKKLYLDLNIVNINNIDNNINIKKIINIQDSTFDDTNKNNINNLIIELLTPVLDKYEQLKLYEGLYKEQIQEIGKHRSLSKNSSSSSINSDTTQDSNKSKNDRVSRNKQIISFAKEIEPNKQKDITNVDIAMNVIKSKIVNIKYSVILLDIFENLYKYFLEMNIDEKERLKNKIFDLGTEILTLQNKINGNRNDNKNETSKVLNVIHTIINDHETSKDLNDIYYEYLKMNDINKEKLSINNYINVIYKNIIKSILQNIDKSDPLFKKIEKNETNLNINYVPNIVQQYNNSLIDKVKNATIDLTNVDIFKENPLKNNPYGKEMYNYINSNNFNELITNLSVIVKKIIGRYQLLINTNSSNMSSFKTCNDTLLQKNKEVEELTAKLSTLQSELDQYIKLKKDLEECNNIRKNLSTENGEKIKQMRVLEDRLNTLTKNSINDKDSIKLQLEEEYKKMQKEKDNLRRMLENNINEMVNELEMSKIKDRDVINKKIEKLKEIKTNYDKDLSNLQNTNISNYEDLNYNYNKKIKSISDSNELFMKSLKESYDAKIETFKELNKNALKEFVEKKKTEYDIELTNAKDIIQKEYDSKIEKLQGEKTFLEEQIQSLTQNNTTLETENNSFKENQNEQITSLSRQLESVNQKLNYTIKNRDDYIENEIREITNNNNMALQRIVEEHEKKLDDNKKEYIKTIEKEIKKIEDKKNDEIDEIKRIHGQSIERLKSEHKSAIDNLNNIHKNKINVLEEELKTLKKSKHAQSISEDTINTNLKQREYNLEQGELQLKQKAQNLQTEYENLIKTHNEEYNILKQSLIDKMNNEIHNQPAKVEDDVGAETETNDETTNEDEDPKNSLLNKKHGKSNLFTKLFTGSIKNSLSKSNELKTCNTELNNCLSSIQELEELKREKEMLTSQIQELTSGTQIDSNASLKNHIDSLSQQLTEKDEIINSLNNQIRSNLEQINIITRGFGIPQNSIEGIQLHSIEISNENTKLKEELQALQENVKSLQQEIMTNNENFKKKLTENEGKYSIDKKECDKIILENETLKTEISNQVDGFNKIVELLTKIDINEDNSERIMSLFANYNNNKIDPTVLLFELSKLVEESKKPLKNQSFTHINNKTLNDMTSNNPTTNSIMLQKEYNPLEYIAKVIKHGAVEDMVNTGVKPTEIILSESAKSFLFNIQDLITSTKNVDILNKFIAKMALENDFAQKFNKFINEDNDLMQSYIDDIKSKNEKINELTNELQIQKDINETANSNDSNKNSKLSRMYKLASSVKQMYYDNKLDKINTCEKLRRESEKIANELIETNKILNLDKSKYNAELNNLKIALKAFEDEDKTYIEFKKNFEDKIETLTNENQQQKEKIKELEKLNNKNYKFKFNILNLLNKLNHSGYTDNVSGPVIDNIVSKSEDGDIIIGPTTDNINPESPTDNNYELGPTDNNITKKSKFNMSKIPHFNVNNKSILNSVKNLLHLNKEQGIEMKNILNYKYKIMNYLKRRNDNYKKIELENRHKVQKCFELLQKNIEYSKVLKHDNENLVKNITKKEYQIRELKKIINTIRQNSVETVYGDIKVIDNIKNQIFEYDKKFKTLMSYVINFKNENEHKIVVLQDILNKAKEQYLKDQDMVSKLQSELSKAKSTFSLKEKELLEQIKKLNKTILDLESDKKSLQSKIDNLNNALDKSKSDYIQLLNINTGLETKISELKNELLLCNTSNNSNITNLNNTKEQNKILLEQNKKLNEQLQNCQNLHSNLLKEENKINLNKLKRIDTLDDTSNNIINNTSNNTLNNTLNNTQNNTQNDIQNDIQNEELYY